MCRGYFLSSVLLVAMVLLPGCDTDTSSSSAQEDQASTTEGAAAGAAEGVSTDGDADEGDSGPGESDPSGDPDDMGTTTEGDGHTDEATCREACSNVVQVCPEAAQDDDYGEDCIPECEASSDDSVDGDFERVRQCLATASSCEAVEQCREDVATQPAASACDNIHVGDYNLENQDDVDALAGYCEITGDLEVYENATLSSVSLPALTSIGRDLWVEETVLTSFSLPALTSIGRSLDVGRNPNLISFELHALTSVRTYVNFTSNDALAQCLVDALVEQLEAGGGIGGEITTHGHDTSCTCSEVGGVLEATCP